MTMGPATVEAVWTRGASTLSAGELTVPVARTARGLEQAAAQLADRILSAGARPRRIAVRTPDGVLRMTHTLPPAPERSPAMADRVEKSEKSNVTPEMVLEFHRQIRDAERKKDEAVALVRSARKRAKAAGVILADYDAANRLRKMDQDERELHLQNLARYASFMGCPLGTQGALFGEVEAPTEKAAAEHAAYEARERGYTDGTHGAPADNNPYPAGSPHAAEWARGWADGDAFRQGIAQPGDEQPKRGARRSRGNPEDRAAA